MIPIMLSKEAHLFLNHLFSHKALLPLELEHYFLDHLCYRVESLETYQDMQQRLSQQALLLVESEINGRNIATYKLHEPILFEKRSIPLIELPEPKTGSPYHTGFEHAEFVISEPFESFTQKHPQFDWNWSGAQKAFNPELKLKLGPQCSIKFHHQSLEKVIAIETGRL